MYEIKSFSRWGNTLQNKDNNNHNNNDEDDPNEAKTVEGGQMLCQPSPPTCISRPNNGPDVPLALLTQTHTHTQIHIHTNAHTQTQTHVHMYIQAN